MLAIEAAQQEKLSLPEMWRNEKWAAISSNTPYALAEDDKAGEARRKQAKEAFINGEASEPAIDFPQLDEIDIATGMVRFDQMISSFHVNVEDNALLLESISRKLAELNRHRYVLDATTASSPEERERYLGYAEALAVDIFGDVDYSVFNGMMIGLKEKAVSKDSVHAQELLDLLPEVDSTIPVPPEKLLTPESIAALAPLVEARFKPALDIVDQLPDGEIEHEEAIVILQQMIDAMGMEGATAVLTVKNALEVDGMSLQLNLGHNRAKLTKETLRTTGLHELIHLIGSYQGRQESDDVLAMGLPNNLAFEEGKCVVTEQIMKGKAVERGANYYIAVGLLRGTLDGERKSFRDTYEVMWRRLLVTNGKTDEKSVEAAKNTAYQTVLRVYRGLATDTRDLSYNVGNTQASEWFNFIAEQETDIAYELLDLTLSTKGDPTNPEHLEYLREHSSRWRHVLEEIGA